MTSNHFELLIYIPTFNRYEKLRNCINIISKEISGLEDRVLVYVSNNGSTDSTREYLQSLEFRWLHITHNEKNIGYALNILPCFDLPIKSEFVWTIGDDDYLMPNSISGVLLLIKEYPLADYIFCNTKAFSSQNFTEIMRHYFKAGSVDGGTVKGRKYGTALVDFEELIDPDIADTLLGELMVNCFRQSSLSSYKYEAIDFNVENADWGELDFETVGKLCQPHNLPFLNCFNGKTKAVYCDAPRTFNFWGSAEWLGDYDYTFPIIILFLISQYKEHGFISDGKYMKLLDYYYSAMRASLTRQINGQSTARQFNSNIKAKMFEFFFQYVNRRWQESEKETAIPMTGPSYASGLTSIIILTFNELKYTRECIESIKKHTPEPHEVIFVDNASTDGTLKWLRKIVKDNANYRLIENERNMGFAKGCNQGIEASTGEYVLLLNNDVVVTDNWLSGMLECLNSAPDTGIVGPMTNNISGSQKVLDTDYRTMDRMHDYAKSFRERYRYRRIPLRRIVGFCMLLRHQQADKIGLLDETFGTGNFEDDDYCLRAALAGFRNLIAGDVFIHHYGSRSFIGNRIDYASTMSGNRKLFDAKWSGIDISSDLGKNFLVLKALDKAHEFYQRGEAEKAVQVILEGMTYAKDDKRLYYNLSEILLDSKLCKGALDAINQIPDGIDDPRALVLAGYCKDGMESSEEAEECAERALSVEGNFALALNLRGVVEYSKTDKGKASEFFKKAIESDPGYGEPYTNLGVIQWSAGNYAEGLGLLEKGFILSPMLSDVGDRYYSAVAQTGSFERAETLLRHTTTLYPLNRRIAFLLIDCLIRQERYEPAMYEIERAMTAFGIDDGMLSAALAVREKVGRKSITGATKGKTISLCVIAKNEEDTLPKCLFSAAPAVDEMIVIDTGSTDRTKEIAEAFGAKVYDYAWNNDFSAARNESLSRASGDWIFILDCDEVISQRDYVALRKLVDSKKMGSAYTFTTRNYMSCANVEGWVKNDGLYSVEEAGTGWIPSCKVRLVPNDRTIRFEKPVHELLEPSLKRAGKKILNSDIPIHHYGKLVTKQCLSKGEEYYQLERKS